MEEPEQPPESAEPALLSDVADGVLTLTLNRPAKRNALSIELRQLIATALGDLDRERIGAVVITGAPPAFCSGMDTTQFGGDADNRRALVDSSLACMNAIGDCPVLRRRDQRTCPRRRLPRRARLRHPHRRADGALWLP